MAQITPDVVTTAINMAIALTNVVGYNISSIRIKVRDRESTVVSVFLSSV
eukprot:CAMPEP_0201691924 /NCGR_PEP_ID=MMETSP0578-20130828/4948_1 /ASSEMBLY_ACC=CAM_ASM_000663 /TAXON_ID=267565 /ORGANISM="Skeletonema grethea, Strain CCMP 1804" /LENGTH=49 /DNA_ID=CAMNT_0048177209 /DNA_START=39 /DNA_END=188 /DNA_ORIENTATION=+